MAGERPLICVIDDTQWLDQSSAQALEVTARRLATDPIGLGTGGFPLGLCPVDCLD